MNHFNLKFGTDVHDRQRHVGTLAKIVVNPEVTHVTHLLVQQGLLFKHTYVLPLEIVAHTQADGIYLNLNPDEFGNFPAFEEHTERVGLRQRDVAALDRMGYMQPMQSYSVDNMIDGDAGMYMEKQVVRQGVDVEDMLWNAHTTIHTYQGYAGTLAQVMVDAEDGRLLDLIMRQGKWLENFLIIPVDLIDQGNEEEIHLGIREENLEKLDFYDPNNLLDIWHTSSSDTAPLLAGRAGQQNNLLAELTTLLVKDPRTETAVIEIICEGGTISLSGKVKDQQTKAAAAEIVSHHPAVITVNNNLKIQPSY